MVCATPLYIHARLVHFRGYILAVCRFVIHDKQKHRPVFTFNYNAFLCWFFLFGYFIKQLSIKIKLNFLIYIRFNTNSTKF